MKRLIPILLVAVFAVSNVDARCKVKYHGDYNFGVGISLSDDSFGRVSLHTVQGVKIGKCFSTGVGVGGDLYFEDDTYLFLPVYLNLKGYLPVGERIAPYLSLDIGCNSGITNNVKGLCGIYCTPAVGLALGKFRLQVGYNIQRLSDDMRELNIEGVQVKLGFSF